MYIWENLNKILREINVMIQVNETVLRYVHNFQFNEISVQMLKIEELWKNPVFDLVKRVA